ncbi:hypothetical protein CNYM01_08210 [Colletotrichum nymphaeae SA-01]|uniref:Nephrocystin 3-like N-terminal domain-containing protein n=1 Tax=Colletotrichum nymphaeae SA-01 TaxID=1460502 RepID=A0A135UWC4_9PEZI|nr:hypothetical protein CNYM01_08210 [Colletotrichum nymphaeae SA-01]
MSRIKKQDLEQGLYVEKDSIVEDRIEYVSTKNAPERKPELDIVVVPGFGANPLKCWAWDSEKGDGSYDVQSQQKDEKFNWITSPDGLSDKFPGARILRYGFASAWQGTCQIDNYFDSIVQGLLILLRKHRKEYNEKGRPIVFIGHSMGGLVIAKALTEMDRLRDDFGELLPCVTGCALFGTPFFGTGMASFFSRVVEMMREKGLKVSGAFWRMMEPDSDFLQTLRREVTHLVKRTSPPIDMRCIYEVLPVERTDYFPEGGSKNNESKSDDESDPSYLSFVKGLEKKKLPELKELKEWYESCLKNDNYCFVTKASATMDSMPGVGLQCNHRGLVTFEHKDTQKYGLVLEELDGLVRTAAVDALRNMLDSGLKHDHDSIVKSHKGEKSWVLQDKRYIEWESLESTSSFFWIQGRPGVGKTSATLSAIASIRHKIKKSLNPGNAGLTPLLAYFLCDSSRNGSSAIELLKSLVLQLISQNPLLADHGKHLLRKSQYHRSIYPADELSGDDTMATMSLPNLWRCFTDIIADDSIGDIYVVINNIHLLKHDEDSESLIESICYGIIAPSNDQNRTEIRSNRRWLITRTEGADGRRFEKLIDTGISYVADLSTSEFAEKVKNSLKYYVQRKVVNLHQTKHYEPDQRYMIEDMMIDHADNTHWIDIQCIRLEELEQQSSTETITKTLGLTNASSLEKLVRHCWLTVLERNPQLTLSLAEILRALVLAFRSPSVEELCILSGIKDESKVILLIDQCAPMIRLDRQEHGITFVKFENATLKNQLLLKSDELLGLSGVSVDEKSRAETKRYHGVLAWRCFSYMQKALSPAVAGVNRSMFVGSSYPLDFWMDHAIRGKSELSEDLARHLHAFWEKASPLRNAWLALSLPTAQSFEHGISTEGMTALHAAAAYGFDRLVSSLITNGHKHEVDCANLEGYTPLHIAAVFNHTETINVLLNYSGEDAVNKHMELLGTPLHLSAIQGHLATLKLLLSRGADPNALSETYGPVINAAIKSGRSEAVQELLGHENIDLDASNPDGSPPLALAAGLSPEDVFKQILLGGKAKWTAQHHRQALAQACRNNKPGNIRALLEHTGTSFNDKTLASAVLTAAIENNWDCVLAISRPDLGGSNVFYLAAVTLREGSASATVLKETWRASHTSIAKEVLNEALYQATDNQKADTVAWLLDHCKADANATDHRPSILDSIRSTVIPTFGNALAAAAWDGTIEIVRTLIKHGAQIDSPTGCPLQLAAKEGHAEVVRHLLSHGAKVDRIPEEEDSYRGSDFQEGTALQAACESGKTEVVRVLLEWKANPNLGRGPYNSPILAATARNRSEILKLLIDAPGIDVNVKGPKNSSTPLMNAAFLMPYEDTELLLNAGADVNQWGPHDETALIRAARKGDARILHLIISRGANILHAGKDEQTALDIAASKANVECLQVLAESVSPLFRGLKRAIANGSTFARDLVARPEDDHDIVDMTTVNQLRERIVGLERDLEDLNRMRKGWNGMMSQVQEAEESTASYKHQMDQMRSDRIEESARIEKERGEYEAARYGFAKLQEEKDALKQNVAAAKLSLETQERDFSMNLQQKQKEMEGIYSLWTDTEARRKSAADEAVEVRRQLQASEDEASRIRQAMSDQIESLQKELEFSKQQADGKATPSGGRDDESFTEGDDVMMSQNAGSSLSVSSAQDATSDTGTGKNAAKRLKDMRHNSAQFMAGIGLKKRGSPKPDGQK